MPRTGDVMILKSDTTLKPCANFTAQIQTLDIPGEVKAGYSPIGFVRCGRSACRMSKVGGCRGGGCSGAGEPGCHERPPSQTPLFLRRSVGTPPLKGLRFLL